MPRRAWLIRSTRTRTVLCPSLEFMQSRCRRTARFWRAAGSATIGGQTRNNIARLDAATGLADSFNPNATIGLQGVYSIAVQADGKIVVGLRLARRIGGQTRNHIARLDAVTGLADSFDPNANNFVYAIAVQADGKILAGGVFTDEQHRRTDPQPLRSFE